MIDDLNTALTREHRLDLAREACTARLVRLARLAAGCKQSVLRHRAEHVVAWLRHGQIGTGIDDLSSAPLTARGCCA